MRRLKVMWFRCYVDRQKDIFLDNSFAKLRKQLEHFLRVDSWLPHRLRPYCYVNYDPFAVWGESSYRRILDIHTLVQSWDETIVAYDMSKKLDRVDLMEMTDDNSLHLVFSTCLYAFNPIAMI